MTDEELVAEARRAGEGDMQAFESLVQRYQEKILMNCRYLTRSLDAEDLAQEVFVKAFFGLQRFEGRAKFSSWLQRIKINHCLNYIDKKKKETWVSVEEPSMAASEELRVSPNADRDLQAVADRQRITRILDGLSDNLRIPLILRDADGLTYQEIADSLGLGLSAVKMRIKRAREEFRRVWEEQEEKGRYVGH